MPVTAPSLVDPNLAKLIELTFGKTPRHALIVEDDHEIAELLGAICQEASYETKVTGNVKDALEAVTPDLSIAFIDLRLPNGIGVRVADAVTECQPNCLIVVMSGYGDEELRKAQLIKPPILLRKPFGADVIRFLLGVRPHAASQ